MSEMVSKVVSKKVFKSENRDLSNNSDTEEDQSIA